MKVKRCTVTAKLKEEKVRVGDAHTVTRIIGKPDHKIELVEAVQHYMTDVLNGYKSLLSTNIPPKYKKVKSKLYSVAFIPTNILLDVLNGTKVVPYNVASFSKDQVKAKDFFEGDTDRVIRVSTNNGEGPAASDSVVAVLVAQKFTPKEICIDLDAYYKDPQVQLSIKHTEQLIKLEHIPFGKTFGFTGPIAKSTNLVEVVINSIKINRESIVALYDGAHEKWVRIPRKLSLGTLVDMTKVIEIASTKVTYAVVIGLPLDNADFDFELTKIFGTYSILDGEGIRKYSAVPVLIKTEGTLSKDKVNADTYIAYIGEDEDQARKIYDTTYKAAKQAASIVASDDGVIDYEGSTPFTQEQEEHPLKPEYLAVNGTLDEFMKTCSLKGAAKENIIDGLVVMFGLSNEQAIMRYNAYKQNPQPK